MENYKKLIEFLQSLEPDAVKFFDKGQSAAGTRLRKGLSELKRMSQDLRNEIQDLRAQKKTSAGPGSENPA